MSEFLTKLRTTAQAQATEVLGRRPPWRAKSVWVAVAMAFLGAALWVMEKASPPASADGTASFAESSPDGPSGQPVIKKNLKPSSPALFRFGASYAGGFFLGWAFRRFLKLSLLLTGAAVAVLAAAKKLGWFEVDWNAIQGHVHQSLAWLQGEAGAAKHFLTGYLPSAAAAAVGGFLGFRHK